MPDKVKELSIRAQIILKEGNLKTKEQVLAYHKKHHITSLRNCGYKTANEILTFYGHDRVVKYCPECKQELP